MSHDVRVLDSHSPPSHPVQPVVGSREHVIDAAPTQGLLQGRPEDFVTADALQVELGLAATDRSVALAAAGPGHADVSTTSVMNSSHRGRLCSSSS